VIFGGVPASNPCVHGEPDNLVLADRSSRRVYISWTLAGAEPRYNFSAWETEDMGIPREGGDVVLLPNGAPVSSEWKQWQGCWLVLCPCSYACGWHRLLAPLELGCHYLMDCQVIWCSSMAHRRAVQEGLFKEHGAICSPHFGLLCSNLTSR
jgi:hypothetical protein